MYTLEKDDCFSSSSCTYKAFTLLLKKNQIGLKNWKKFEVTIKNKSQPRSNNECDGNTGPAPKACSPRR